jgi:hypothetical protein
VSPHSRDAPSTPQPRRAARELGIPRHLLIACGPLGPRLSATVAANALARGIRDAGSPEPDICELPPSDAHGEDARRLLDKLDFDARMRRARAVVIGAERLQERTLAGSVTFEIATRARQSGVPAYAVTGNNALNVFDARILDLQVILEARSRSGLIAAARKLGALS